MERIEANSLTNSVERLLDHHNVRYNMGCGVLNNFYVDSVEMGLAHLVIISISDTGIFDIQRRLMSDQYTLRKLETLFY